MVFVHDCDCKVARFGLGVGGNRVDGGFDGGGEMKPAKFWQIAPKMRSDHCCKNVRFAEISAHLVHFIRDA